MSWLFRTLRLGSVAGIDIFLHWTMWLLPIVILVRGLVLFSVPEAFLQASLVAGLYCCLTVVEAVHVMTARYVGLKIRDLTFYPVGASARLREISERPWKETRVAASGPTAMAAIAGLLAAGLLAMGQDLTPRLDATEPVLETYFNRLFWLMVLMTLLHLVPAFPMDGGRLFRGALSLSAPRLRATEVAALLSSFAALVFLVIGLVWITSAWWLILVGIVVHVSGQQELLRMRFFSSLRDPTPPATPAASPIMVPVEKLLDEDARPDDPRFSGFTWSPKTRLWIVWRDGQPVSATALVGE